MKDLFGVHAAGLPERTRVKICGITRKEDGDAAVDLGADALGFNTSRTSKRFIDVRREADWIRYLPPLVTRVAVTVNATICEIEELVSLQLFDLIQLHGAEDAAFCELLAGRGVPFIKAIALGSESSPGDMERFGAAAILLDTYSPRGFGGTGELIDMDAVAVFAGRNPALRIVVSGGLRPGNVADVVRRIRPYAVDVASGVENEPRRKDRKLLASFIGAVRGVG